VGDLMEEEVEQKTKKKRKPNDAEQYDALISFYNGPHKEND